MVSLGQPGRNSRTGGVYFFSSEAELMADGEESSFDSDVAVLADEPIYRKIPTTTVIMIEILFTVLLFAAIFSIPFNIDSRTACFILYCTHSAFWFVFLGINIYLYYQHQMIRRHGYLEFYRKTQMLQTTPIFIVSGGNALLLLSSSFIYKYCPSDTSATCPEGSRLSCSVYIQIILGLECIILLSVLIRHLVLTVQFNKRKGLPDVYQEDVSISYAHPYGHLREIGVRDEDYVGQMLDRQSDMIHYLKQHCSHLSKKILKLTLRLHEINKC